MMGDEVEQTLFRTDPSTFGTAEEYRSYLLEQYKIFITSAEKISDRRQTANSFYVTLNTVIITLVSYLHRGQGENLDNYFLIPLAGVVVSYTWLRLLRSYKDLNTAKFSVIHMIENKLPLNMYDAEWEALGRGKDTKKYRSFTSLEFTIPGVFIGLHTVALVMSFPWSLIGCLFH